ncbi:Lrp/AsnC family transcriptional regulator [Nocardioides acrostichi]|uniref:Lrp/AsnC family transcriptional regulator n=1 Tax=Nocardioides acrostichi TaxID=2784339 RepID=A0A930Y8V3_9ACTN|nr:Lrp/AsnC family transcriptional regulator [Nocardioides acrostichi]MBF4163461.1 Lrp/AsnC family transcriptional regulator [Nocardioides acrostichi]
MDAASRGQRLDALDVALVEHVRAHPRVGDLELSRLLGVARATVQSRLARLQESGVIAGWGPDIDLRAAGLPVQAFVSLEISQGALERVEEDLVAMPQILEAYVTTGSSDVLCRVVASSHEGLQDALITLNHSPSIVRSTSVMVLTELVRPRPEALLATVASADAPRVPAFRRPTDRADAADATDEAGD